MEDFSKLYFFLFNQITDALAALDAGDAAAAREILIKAQQESEERFIKD